MAAIRGKNTKPEIVVRSALHRMGFRFRIHRKDLPGKPDIVFVSKRKIILVHGCFWHMHKCRYGAVIPATNTEFWQAKRRSNVERDIRNVAHLRKAGWRVLTLWECQVSDDGWLTRVLKNFVA
jgi:DNA mismatch endonuclease, patch repair protein